MFATRSLLAGGPRYPYPRRVYSLWGGWWPGNRNQRANGAVFVTALISLYWFVIFPYSSKHEWRYVAPTRPLPSMRWMKQYEDDPYGEKMFAGQERYKPAEPHH